MRIEDHTSGCVAYMAVLAGKLWFLGKSRSNPLCMGEWVCCGCCLVRLNVAFRELSNSGSCKGWMALASHMGEYFGKTLVLEQWGVRKLSKKWNFLLESPI